VLAGDKGGWTDVHISFTEIAERNLLLPTANCSLIQCHYFT